MSVKKAVPFTDVSRDPFIRGFLHTPDKASGDGMVLTHGAGSNCQSPLLIVMAEAFTSKGFTVLRCDLPFRQDRPFGPPGPRNGVRDRKGLRNAATVLRGMAPGRIFLAGHSYGGRQATMLAAEEPKVADGLLLFSYPLHPPRKPEQLRTQHWHELQMQALFVHGSRDPFGSIQEMEVALKLVPAKTKLLTVDGEGHDLGFKGKAKREELSSSVLSAFLEFMK